jgi:predicted AAA+ superfamily ATPase
MLPRAISPTLQRLAASFPVLAITGPRQSGKTTLARALFADKPYVSLEDPRGFLARFAQGAVFDEAQRWPDLFSHLQGMVDADRRPSRFVLTGSRAHGLTTVWFAGGCHPVPGGAGGHDAPVAARGQ